MKTAVPELPTNAEKQAEQAQKYPAFSCINLHNVRTTVTELVSLIGRLGIFEEYSKHDIAHIDKLLTMLDWLIPSQTQSVMSPADWLMMVLSIYFHDLGMLVTRTEYENRVASGFQQYKDNAFHGPDGEDYKAKIIAMGEEKAERFLYQEFVRTNHAKRIKQWITGQNAKEYGVTEDTRIEVRKLVEPLGPKFCRDLGNVCESHHLDDLNDVNKYKVSQPYGDSNEETANLQYIAILLRTVDLLHVSKDRTPSIAFRLINPTDPISQDEWHKQMAVVTVRSKVAVDKEGNANSLLPRDAIEISAFFDNPRGFFALTRYAAYVEKQLKMSFDWCREARQQKGAKHEFPWRYVDDKDIETQGFLSNQFEFTLDQAKILDLLTGHTLYNDLRVVLRELVQNSFDAIRLQSLITKTTSIGAVSIRWDSASRELTVEDQGTGMTQDIIEKHLLKVGSSRYQDPDFKKYYPGFSSISRFGIGVLSAFMISDEVEILTSHEEEPQARQLSLRSVHGKYLIRLLEKNSDEASTVFPHGTRIRLKVRQSVKMPDVLQTARTWIVLPGCKVSVHIDGNEHRVGFTNLEEALKEYCSIVGINLNEKENDSTKIKIITKKRNGIELALAVEWSSTFKEWSFVRPRQRRDGTWEPLGLCIEGIRVTFDTPGFVGFPLVAIVNASGPSAPKTNVARSGLESTPEGDATLAAIYGILVSHVADEVTALVKERGFSLTWSSKEGKWIIQAMLRDQREARPLHNQIFDTEINKAPILVMERGDKRRIVSPFEFQSEKAFWAIDCGFFSSAESLLREVPGEGSLGALSRSISAEFPLPNEPILCGVESWQTIDQGAVAGKEVGEFKVFEPQRRIDVRWAPIASPPRWIPIPDYARMAVGRDRPMDVLIATQKVDVSGAVSYTALRAFGQFYILNSSALAPLILKLIDEAAGELFPSPNSSFLGAVCHTVVAKFMGSQFLSDEELLQQNLTRFGRLAEQVLGKHRTSVLKALQQESWRYFDASRWHRQIMQ
jgi:molecular chaperone HtpG